jgi:hypothetical protein
MKLYFQIIFSISALTMLCFSCKPKFEPEEFTKGEIDPSRFVMIGGGQAGGYMNDGLYFEGQENSLANIIARQLAKVGGGDFYQPLVDPSSIGISSNLLSPMKLGYKTDCKGVTSLSPIRIAAQGDFSLFIQNIYSPSTFFGNYGIPRLKLSEVFYTSVPNASSNPFFARMASSTNASVIDDAFASQPTFFSLFFGLEEVLEYAKSGGTIENITPNILFHGYYEQILQIATANGAKGVLAKIPDVTEMPYFSTIPWNGLTLDAASNTTLNSIYNPLGYYFSIGSNPFMIVDSTANDFAVRQILPTELLTLSLPLDSVKCNQMGVLFPIRDEFVLDEGELQYLQSLIAVYNQIIRDLATKYNLAIVDVHEFSKNLKTGFVYNGVTMSSKFVSGGAYSLDGIHLNAKGNALLANEFIKSINQKYKARIPLVDVNAYNATFFP